MAYSMFECPKLHNARSLKFYPEHYDHHVSFRHKTLPQDFSMTSEKDKLANKPDDTKNPSMQVQNSSSDRKCPIYVHNFGKTDRNFGDFLAKTNCKKNKKQQSVLEKLEESYWANWKPDKNSPRNKKTPEIEIIKSAPVHRRKIKIFPQDSHENKVHKITSRSQEIQTEDLTTPPVPPTICEESATQSQEDTEQTDNYDKFLKHTDSFILNSKKHKEEKEEKFEQPRCIRLYKKPTKIASKNFVKGGSYPLKPCLKKDSSFAKNNRFGRPGSPVIGTTHHFGKYKSFHKHHH